MKLVAAVVLALSASAPAFAAPAGFLVDFEKRWDYANGDVVGYYAGGVAADGTRGPNLGVSFVNVSGLSNDPGFTYFSGAPSSLGVAYAHSIDATDRAFINVADGVGRMLSFWYASPVAVTGAIKAYTGLNGTGTLLASFDLAANSSSAYDRWTQVNFAFPEFARSFDLTAAGIDSVVAFDNIRATAVPEPTTVALLFGGAALLVRRRRRAAR